MSFDADPASGYPSTATAGSRVAVVLVVLGGRLTIGGAPPRRLPCGRLWLDSQHQ